MTKHDAKVIVEDAVRDLKMSSRCELCVQVRREALHAIAECRRESWFAQHHAMLYRDNKLIRFVLSSGVTI